MMFFDLPFNRNNLNIQNHIAVTFSFRWFNIYWALFLTNCTERRPIITHWEIVKFLSWCKWWDIYFIIKCQIIFFPWSSCWCRRGTMFSMCIWSCCRCCSMICRSLCSCWSISTMICCRSICTMVCSGRRCFCNMVSSSWWICCCRWSCRWTCYNELNFT